MRSLISKCLALAVAAMCCLGTAHAQQVPLELRPKLKELQEREQALLDARRVLAELVNDRTSLAVVVPVESDGRTIWVPVAVPRTNLLTTLVLDTITDRQPALVLERVVNYLLRQDRSLREQIQQVRIPDIDNRLAETRSEVNKLMAQGGGTGRGSPVSVQANLIGVWDSADGSEIEIHETGPNTYEATFVRTTPYLQQSGHEAGQLEIRNIRWVGSAYGGEILFKSPSDHKGWWVPWTTTVQGDNLATSLGTLVRKK